MTPNKTYWKHLSLSLIVMFLFGLSTIAQADSDICYVVADSGDQLEQVDRTGGAPIWTDIGATGTSNIEAAAIYLDGATLYAANAGQLGTLDTGTGTFTATSSPFGTGSGAQGDVAFDDVDGLAFDALTSYFYGAQRESGEDLLFRIDRTTGAHVPDAFGLGIDYVVIQTQNEFGSSNLDDIDDIAIDPRDGQMYAVTNNNGGADHLIRIDKQTGSVTDIDVFTNSSGGANVVDMEGLGFYNNGVFYGTTGNGGSGAGTDDSLWEIELATGIATIITDIEASSGRSDYEAVACLTGGGNNITGTVFIDTDSDGINNDGNGGWPNVDVQLYLDVNGNGVVDGGDVLIQTDTTDANGDYSFLTASTGPFVMQFDTGTQPSNTVVTTDNVETADFLIGAPPSFGVTDANNDFGLISAIDYGDNPASYQDASHNFGSTLTTLYIGSVSPDAESSTQGVNGLGDDSDGNDDEEGVTFSASGGVVPQEVRAAVDVVNDTGADAYLCAWLDVGLDGAFDASDARTCETVADNNGTATTVNLTWTGLPETQGTTYARFRLCSDISICSGPDNTSTTDSASVANNESQLIPDGDGYDSCQAGGGLGVSKAFNIIDSFTISDVNLSLNISHDWRGDFRISLISPLGTEVFLTTFPTFPNNSANNIGVIFDDEAGDAYSTDFDNHSPIIPLRLLAPVGSLGDFDTENSLGTWTLRFCDMWDGVIGTFNSATLELTGPTTGGPATDGEVEDYPLTFDFRPTAVTIGKVELNTMSIVNYFIGLGAGSLSKDSLYSLLSNWDAEQAESLVNADRDELLQALQNYLDPDADGQLAVIAWDTLEERGTIGFYVERREAGGQWQRIHNDMLPGLITAPMGGAYQLADPSAVAGVQYEYQLIEQEARGTTKTYGPYVLEIQQ